MVFDAIITLPVCSVFVACICVFVEILRDLIVKVLGVVSLLFMQRFLGHDKLDPYPIQRKHAQLPRFREHLPQDTDLGI